MKKALPMYALVIFGLLSLLPYNGATVSAQTADPTLPGPFTVAREEYDFGDSALSMPGFPAIEFRGSVHYPTNWRGGPLPLLIFLHGRHVTCNQANVESFGWPCSANQTPIPSYQGYDYIAQVLASNGYFVVSISANGINAKDSGASDGGAQARASLIQTHLTLWKTLNTTGGAPFGTKFVGKIDMNRIGTMGHSRGGEGVVRHYLFNQSLGSPFNIKAVFALAPIDFNRYVVNNVPLAVLLPYCDGDVRDLEGVHFYDDARYNVPGDTAPKHTILVVGANHNFYNTIWTPGLYPYATSDDFRIGDTFCAGQGGTGRLTDTQQRATGLSYVAAFMRAYVGGESQFLPLLTTGMTPLPSAGTDKIYVSYHAPDDPQQRFDVNRMLDNTNLLADTPGGGVGSPGLMPYNVCGGAFEQTPCIPQASNIQQPHTAPSFSSSAPGLSQLGTGWNDPSGAWVNNLPEGHRDVSQFQALQFRAGVNFNDSRNTNLAQNFRVALTDGRGFTASVKVSDFSSALYFPPGASTVVPKLVLNMIRLPLSAFTGVRLNDIRSISFFFDQRKAGGLMVTDVAFDSAAHITLPPFSVDGCMKDASTGSEVVFNTATGNYAFCCNGGAPITGVGSVTIQGNIVTIVQGASETDRQLTISWDRSTGIGKASLKIGSSPGCGIVSKGKSTCTCAQTP